MKKHISNKSSKNIKFLFLGILMIGLYSCEIQENYEYNPSPTNPKIEMSCWEFIQQRSDIMSIMQEAVNRAEMKNYYSDNKGYTYILPRNNAWTKYLKAKKYTSVSDIPIETLQIVLKYHLVKASVNFSDPSILDKDTPISYNTESGEVIYLSRNSNYQGLINQGTKKSWTIITSNIEATNGTLHVVDDVVSLIK